MVSFEQVLFEDGDVGLDERHLDVVARQFEAQRLRQTLDGVLGARVERQARLRIALLAGQTAHVHDPTWCAKVVFQSVGIAFSLLTTTRNESTASNVASLPLADFSSGRKVRTVWTTPRKLTSNCF